MKKRFLSRLAAVMVLCILVVATIGAPLAAQAATRMFLIDGAGLLNSSQYVEINAYAEALSIESDVDIIIFTLDDMGGGDTLAAAESLYIEYGLGNGADKSGIMLMLSMADRNGRDFALIAHGYGNTVLTDYGRETLIDEFLPLLREDDFYGAFVTFLDGCAYRLEFERGGEAFDVHTDPNANKPSFVTSLVVIVAVPCLIAGLFCAANAAKMRTAKVQRAAHAYVPQNGFNLTNSNDMYVYRTETRTPIQSSSSSSSGTTTNSSGFSGSSGKF